MNNAFEPLFFDELASRAGALVEIATDNNLVVGVLSFVSAEILLVVDAGSGYGSSSKEYVSLNSINYVRFPNAA